MIVRWGSPTANLSRLAWSSWAGKVANGITTVALSYVRERTGHALIGLATASLPYHLLIRRHLATGELAFHYGDVPGRPAGEQGPADPRRRAQMARGSASARADAGPRRVPPPRVA
jgi:hypothetical protein